MARHDPTWVDLSFEIEALLRSWMDVELCFSVGFVKWSRGGLKLRQ